MINVRYYAVGKTLDYYMLWFYTGSTGQSYISIDHSEPENNVWESTNKKKRVVISVFSSSALKFLFQLLFQL